MNYYDNPAISASGLKLMQVPLVFWDKYINPNPPEKEETDAMLRGSAFHAGFLEAGEFDNRYTVMPEGLHGSSNAAKEVKKLIKESGKKVLKPGEKSVIGIDRIKGMVESAHKHPISKLIFSLNPEIEKVFEWTDPETGEPCKMKADIYIAPCERLPRGLIVDPKSCDDASKEWFHKSIKDQQMWIQAAFYTDGIKAIAGYEPDFLWLAQEYNRPYLNKYHPASPEIIAYGRREYRRLLNKYIECRSRNEWPGYDTTIEPLNMPKYLNDLLSNNP